jgi:hypothetical protein
MNYARSAMYIAEEKEMSNHSAVMPFYFAPAEGARSDRKTYHGRARDMTVTS